MADPEAPGGEPRTSRQQHNTGGGDEPQASVKKQRDWYDLTLLAVLTGTLIAVGFAAVFAFLQVDILNNTANRQLRAYIVALEPTVGNLHPGPLRLGYKIENIGQTPAYNVRRTHIVQIYPYPLPGGVPEKWPDFGPTFYLARVGTVTGVQSRVFSREEIAEIKSGVNRRLYIIGRVVYDDVFDNTRLTTFCFMYEGKPTGRFVNCQTLNIAT